MSRMKAGDFYIWQGELRMCVEDKGAREFMSLNSRGKIREIHHDTAIRTVLMNMKDLERVLKKLNIC